MKRKWQHPTEPAEASRIHWRSLGELEESTEFKGWLEREFPQGAAELEMDETSRRSFVKLMGASTALAGFGVSCSRPLAHLVPYNEHVEWVIPGKALYYSTAKPRLGGIGCEPLVVTTHEGRPTKVDGNRLHPASSGSSNAYTQASILDLYDQDRSKGVLSGGKATAAKDFDESFLKGFREAGTGEKVAMLVSRSTSPTRNRMLAQVQAKYPGIAIYAYEALEGPGESFFGPGVVPVADLAKANRILSLDCDFLGNEPVGEDSVAEFSAARSVDGGGEMNRLYVAEPAFTLTGGMSDHRYRVPASQMLAVAALIARELGVSSAQVDAVISELVEPVYNMDWIRECAADLAAHKGEAVVLAGGRQSEAVQSIVAGINQSLGAFGPIISLFDHKLPDFGTIEDLAASLKDGGVDTLFVLNHGDVVFDAPADLKIGELFSKVPTTVHLGERVNETAKAATWHVPGTHYLESWGDHYSVSGFYSVQQPMIDPLWGGVSENVFLLSLLSEESSEGAVLGWVKETFTSAGGKDWDVALRDGVAAEIPQLASVGFSPADKAGKVEVPDLPHPEGLEVALTQSGATYDGRFVNNGWLQEAPDPISKLTWDNAALISQYTAESFDLEDGDLVILSVGGREIRVPVLVSPGHADFSISLALGYYGDKADGSVSRGVGFDAYPLRSSAQPYLVTGVTVRKASAKKHELALTAEHYSMEGRAIAREGTVEMFEEDPHFAEHQGMDHHIPENISLYKGANYMHPEDEKGNAVIKQIPGHEFRVDPLHQWAMTVDLNTCTGCNACVISCQAENNIPIVGKDQVLGGREMHWIRMDRYFTSPKDSETIAERGTAWDYITGAESTKDTPGKRAIDDDSVEMITQPVACVQCESAPCETVCPVNATVHTGDGLNAMTYNRCIGTRYCANNCPYKARRFNYYDYNKRPIEKISVMGIEAEGIKFGPLAPANGHATTTQRMAKNPNVTVRMRGVIEKCTYCVQRISAAKIAAKAAARDSDDIQVKTHAISVACQDACGAGAITFGNLKDPDDKINLAKKNPRNYDLLKYIGTRPRTSYLARIKNPNPKMPGADKVGTVTSKMH